MCTVTVKVYSLFSNADIKLKKTDKFNLHLTFVTHHVPVSLPFLDCYLILHVLTCFHSQSLPGTFHRQRWGYAKLCCHKEGASIVSCRDIHRTHKRNYLRVLLSVWIRQWRNEACDPGLRPMRVRGWRDRGVSPWAGCPRTSSNLPCVKKKSVRG